ncbi:hypothetical protein L1787_05615 [Acuticoccus sp. M5D2P5]|uniref:hypothetical protein n=1 Tax=Acuticoccus kalidii TaxID=2910977 RepID=UPI001F165FD6|nr:hypothetical protein [Acuticoccus kalidii]MCF3932891.1 hypothetical protein [Acuticoccus kalidii]
MTDAAIEQPVVFTLHAYERFCQRGWTANFATVMNYCLTPDRTRYIRMGASRVPLPAEGLVMVVQDRTVVTVQKTEKLTERLRRMQRGPKRGKKPRRRRREKLWRERWEGRGMQL